MGYACAIIVNTNAIQVLPELLMDQFDTLPTQWRHIEHIHEGVLFKSNYYWHNCSYEDVDNFSGLY